LISLALTWRQVMPRSIGATSKPPPAATPRTVA